MAVHKDTHLGKLENAMSEREAHPSHSWAANESQATDAEDAPEGVTLERAAEIEAFLAVLTDEPRDALLARFDIDEERWGQARKVWTERIEDEVKRAAAPGQRLRAEEKYRLSMRYSIAYTRAAEQARDDEDKPEAVDPLATTSALGAHRTLRLGSTHG